ncbi:DUF6458 family protein [Actinomycetospora straminea]|uniref:DUF6458 domain-containing protein n=1 Tax=Actinomycetospora straminea TaxID=663607 RepID=A0ABP9EAP3_9PSEU|nr:DUF6458 family protein [Actinomycetospora straminea]MDD7936497.1 DUF6458 family protein [Actinomycetospora straminea]
MRIGSSIALIAIGLILALAVNFSLSGIDIQLVGWILVVVGIIGLVVSVAVARRARTVVRREDGLPPTRGL